jgi:hypothetical protein
MKKLLASLLGLALACAVPAFSFGQGQAIGPPNFAVCNKIAFFTGTAAPAQLIALATTPTGPGGAQPTIYICGWQFTNTAASGSVVLSYGTGANCGTGTVTLTPAISVGSNAVSIYTGVPSVVTAPGNALCQNSTATITGIVWYSQF